MSVEAISWALSFAAENVSEKAVTLVLANYADGDGKCFPGQQNIAQQAACSDRTVRRVLESLEARGIISREQRRRKDGSRTSDIIVLLAFQQQANMAGRQATNRTTCPNQPDNLSGLTTFEPSEDTSAAAARAKSDLDGMTNRLLDAAGDKIQPHGSIVLSAIIGLIESGCDLETDILPTIRAVASRLKRPAGSWAYFVPAIQDAHSARIAAGKGVVKPPTPEASDRRWQTRLTMARAQGQWSSTEWGPAPGQPGSIVPKHLLQPGDGEGWREWQSEAA